MSNIYIQEPPTHGKVCLETTVGDIEIELFSRECPKACRNFVQLCMENYYDKTKFHRVVKGFIVQGGDPTGTGQGGESIYGSPFKDEFHSRLRFARRGLVAMANAGKDDNGSQFFFTLGEASELQNKHTLFGKVVGDTIYNMIKLGEGSVENERPTQPHKILKTKVLINPFPDIQPRQLIQMLTDEDDLKRKEGKSKSKMNATKDFKLLSFGDEAEEDEETMTSSETKFKSKSSHDLLNDPKLSKDVGREFDAVAVPVKQAPLDVETVRSKLTKKPEKTLPHKLSGDRVTDTKKLSSNMKKYDDDGSDASSEEDERSRIQKEIKALKKDLRAPKKKDDVKLDDTLPTSKGQEEEKNEILKAFHEEQSKYSQIAKSKVPKKGSAREAMTLELLSKFTSKLRSVNESQGEEASSKKLKVDDDNDDDIAGDDWLGHTLKFENDDPILAKDANTKGDDWFDIFDPRNPLAKRRREQSKKDMKKKK